MRGKVWIEGAVVPAETARVSVFDRGFLYGDAAFETVRVYEGVPFALELHLARLLEATQRLGFEPPLDPRAVRAAVRATLDSAAQPEAYLRIVASRGSASPGLMPSAGSLGLVIYVLEAGPHVPAPETYRVGRTAVVLAPQRPSLRPADPTLKTLNYLTNVLATAAARRAGADEAILLAADGVHVTEAASANLFALVEGTWVTPENDATLLPGITRRLVLELMRANVVRCAERPLKRADLECATEVFLTSSLREVMPIVRLDGRAVGTGLPGEATRAVHSLYGAAVAREVAAARR